MRRLQVNMMATKLDDEAERSGTVCVHANRQVSVCMTNGLRKIDSHLQSSLEANSFPTTSSMAGKFNDCSADEFIARKLRERERERVGVIC